MYVSLASSAPSGGFGENTVPYLLPLLHPAAIVRGRWADEPAQIAYLRRLAKHLKEDTVPKLEDYTQTPPGGLMFPNLEDLATFRLTLQDLSIPCVAYDIENAGPHMICIGMYGLDLETWEVGAGLCLPFKLQGGRDYWQHWKDHLEATRWLGELLGDHGIASLFHNGITFDVPVLEELGFKVEGRMLDTMVMAHYLYPEMKKGLQYLSTLYLGAGVWKSLVEEEKDL
jgi:hypothetical protein